MSYVNRVLQPGETVRYRGTLHWIVYLPAILIAVLGVAVAFVLFTQTNDPNLTAGTTGGALVVAFLVFLPAWFRRMSTEIAVTDRRVIFKEGFIGRQTVETHMEKVESVDVDQSVLGRLLNYGDVTVHGTGAGREALRRLQSPLEFRNAITAR